MKFSIKVINGIILLCLSCFSFAAPMYKINYQAEISITSANATSSIGTFIDGSVTITSDMPNFSSSGISYLGKDYVSSEFSFDGITYNQPVSSPSYQYNTAFAANDTNSMGSVPDGSDTLQFHGNSSTSPHVYIHLRDSTGSLFDATSLGSLTDITLDDFDYSLFTLSFDDNAGSYKYLRGVITSLSITSVPEPSALFLFLFGALLLLCIRKNVLRNYNNS